MSAAEPIDPTEQTDPIDPIDRIEPSLAIESTESRDRHDRDDPIAALYSRGRVAPSWPPPWVDSRASADNRVKAGRMTTIAWRSIERGWDVISSDGTQVGVVFLVVGDENADIFDGLAITAHAGPAVFHNYADRPHYAAAEQVASIDPGRVTLSISAEEAAHLPLHDVPESAEIEPEGASRLERAETWFEHKTGQDRTE